MDRKALLGIIFSALVGIPGAWAAPPSSNPAWNSGLEEGRRLNKEMKTNPGEKMYAPAQGITDFTTWAADPANATSFRASIYGPDMNVHPVSQYRICISDFTTEGVEIRMDDGASGRTFTVSGIGRYGVAMCNAPVNTWDDCLYYAWTFDAGSKTLALDQAIPPGMSEAMERPLPQVMRNFVCTSPSLCNIATPTLTANYTSLLNKLAIGAMEAVQTNAPQYIVSAYHTPDLDPRCVGYVIVGMSDDPSSSLRCWGLDGPTPVCVPVQGLEERGAGMEVLSPSESYALTQSEKSSFFYQDPVSGLQIRSPYSLVAERGEAHAFGGNSANCIVQNDAWGSRETGWVNNVNGHECAQFDWNCIHEQVSEKCATFEADPSCVLLEELVDSVPNIQFGQYTNMIRERNGYCWKLTLDPTQPAPVLPSWLSDPGLQIFDRDGVWWTCGDFEVIQRRYLCRDLGEDYVDADVLDSVRAACEITSTENLENYYDESTDTWTGFQTIQGGASSHVLNFEQGVDFESYEQEECPDEEKACVVTWRASDVIYGDSRPRGDMNPAGPGGDPQDPVVDEPPMVRKEIRACEKDESGELYCPYDPAAGETVLKKDPLGPDCACLNLLGEGLSYLSILRMVSDDIKCGDTYIDGYLQDYHELTDHPICDRSGLPQIWVCGEYEPGQEGDQIGVECEPFIINRIAPLALIQVKLWAGPAYMCNMSWSEDESITTSPGQVNPRRSWFNYCYSELEDKASEYLEDDLAFNAGGYPPLNLCEPSLWNGVLYDWSRPTGCGYDAWEITNGPARIDHVHLAAASEFPFGYVEMGYQVRREYDCLRQGLDCGGDGWLDCFDCIWRDEGYDCGGDCVSDNDYRNCISVSGWDCTADGCDSREYDSCTFQPDGYDCDGDNITDHPHCELVTGYDCGMNHGGDANQAPDGCIDNEYRYCAHVLAGWDCDHNCNGHPGDWSSGSNNRIAGGSCYNTANLADGECGIAPSDKTSYRCSRIDNPGRCCVEDKTFSLWIQIQNKDYSNNYYCRLWDPGLTPSGDVEIYNIPYDDPATPADDEARFLVEGCREAWNEVYFSSNVSPEGETAATQEEFRGLEWNYVRYEDLLERIARERCEWRDYLTFCVCMEEQPFRDVGDTNYVFAEDLGDPRIVLGNYTPEPPLPAECGNGICELGERYTCLEDCGAPGGGLP